MPGGEGGGGGVVQCNKTNVTSMRGGLHERLHADHAGMSYLFYYTKQHPHAKLLSLYLPKGYKRLSSLV